MDIVFTAAGCHQGQPHRGVAYGYTSALTAIKHTDEFKNVRILYNDCRESEQFGDPIHGSYMIGKHIQNVIESNDSDHPIMLTFGGDHTISFGTLMQSLQRDPDTILIWIDAHSDINSPDTSMSGNCHGMPVSYILGLSEHEEIGDTLNHLKPQNLVYIGLRSIDPAEELILQDLEKEGMVRFSAAYIIKHGIASVIDSLNEKFGMDADDVTYKPNIHISLDIDSIDPCYAPATGTPVENGLHPTEVIEIIKWANETTSNLKAHLDVTEINPDLSDLEGAAKTYAVVDLILDTYLCT
jgi:arginase